MFSFFKKHKKAHAPTFTKKEMKEQSTTLLTHYISLNSFVEKHEGIGNIDEQKEMLEMAIHLVSTYISNGTEQDIINFLHPNHNTVRQKVLNELHVEKQHYLRDLNQLRQIIQRSNSVEKKEKYRIIKEKLEHSIDPYIRKINDYNERFSYEETRDQGFQTFHDLFEYLSEIEEKYENNKKLG
ncbi:hypothetical protein [Bacillus solimangrovi]|uniref:Uncharacterized protein n=1 Tax=Bacillus solimangrovi TaxID=1305675 RepID=A0A1E5LJQ3_9BACI|nr:hypothetical protein [Bacillus solimangrovi]OEH94317.1 hypothetical protein BFG57_08660 [Bacillus solimangrovi]